MVNLTLPHLSAIASSVRTILANADACAALASVAPAELAAMTTHLGCLDALDTISDTAANTNIDERLSDELISQRNACAAALAAAGFTHVTMTYSGCGDEGNLGDIVCEPSSIDLSNELHNMLSDFGDDFMEAIAPSYEDGEGGGSEIVFDIAGRTFHADVYNNEVVQFSFVEGNTPLPLESDAAAPQAKLEPAE